MITTLYRTPVRSSISVSFDGVNVVLLRPAVTARPSGEPWEVRMRNRTSVLGSILFPVVSNVSCYRLLCIPRSANQHLVTRHVPFSNHRPLAPLAKTAQSEGRHDLETDHEAGE